MENEKGSERGNQRPDRDAEEGWPQRPPSRRPEPHRPRLEPPIERGPGGHNVGNRQDEGTRETASKWTSYSTGAGEKSTEGDGKETRVLPLVEPSRFDNGRQSRTPAAVPPQARTQAPARRQPPEQGYHQGPTPARVRPPADSDYDAQHTDEDEGYDYAAQQDVTQKRRHVLTPRANTQGAWPGSDPRRSYLSVDIEAPKRRSAGWALWLIVGVLAIALIGGVGFSLAWQGQYAGKIYSGVSVLGLDLGGKTPEDATKILRDKTQEFVRQPVTLTWQGKEWRPSADQIGIKVDVDSTVSEAFAVGRGTDTVGNVSQQWSAAQAGYKVPMTVQLNEPALQAYLSTIAENEINQKLFEGDIRLNGTQIVSQPGKEGRGLRIYEAISAVRQSVATLQPGKVELPVDITEPTVSAQEVNYVEGLLAVRISGPITATTSSGKILTLDRDALVRFTTIERNPDRSAARHVDLGWKDGELKVLGDKWATEANRSAQNARFAWNNGSVAVLSESIDGFQTDTASVISSIKDHSGTTDARQYQLPGKVLTPTVSSKELGTLGIKELMGTGVSTFKGSSQERATNIKVAANLLNGAVVPPGGTFSFLDTIGGIDEAHGFVEGFVIAAERTQRGVGGGVCQVSTTTFRAAFWSGVKIMERNQHSYRVGWYEANGEPVGFDAAVFDPGVDLKFINDSPGYILVEAAVSPDTLTVNFYGTKPAGTVKLEGPAISNKVPPPPDVYEVDTRLPSGTRKQVETAHGGLDTLITRRVTLPGQPDKVDQFRSSYKAWPNWFVVASPSQIPGGVQAAPKPTPNP